MKALADPLRRGARASTSVASWLLVALLPKCPLCVAAALSAVGVSASLGALLAPLLRPVAWALAAACAVWLVRAEWRRRRDIRSRERTCPCEKPDRSVF